MDVSQSPQLRTTALLSRRSEPHSQPTPLNRPLPPLWTGALVRPVLLVLLLVAQFGVSGAEVLNVADNRILTVVAFVLSLGSTYIWGWILYVRKADGLTYSQWSPFVAQAVLSVLKLVAVWYQFNLGPAGDNPFITDYSFVPLFLGNATHLIDGDAGGRRLRRDVKVAEKKDVKVAEKKDVKVAENAA